MPPPIRLCAFDMDGLLIDSEDLYTICTNEVLREYGKPDLPWSIKAQLQGRPAQEAGRIFHEWAQLPISREEFLQKQSVLQRKYFPTTKPLPGVPALLEKLSKTSNPHVHLALATSSHSGNFKLKTAHLEDLFSVFKQEHRVLGDDPRIPPGRGKPAPDIYLLALKTINESMKGTDETEIKPEECLVFEDSVPGVEAGLNAGMQVVWCPHPGLLQEYRGREQEVLTGLTRKRPDDEGQQITSRVEDELNVKSPSKERQAEKELHNRIGQGRSRLFQTLEDFPYEDYGIKIET